MKELPRLKKEYVEKYRDELKKELKLDNIMEVPMFNKIVLNVGMGEALENKDAIEDMTKQFELITGQKPVVKKAKKAISGFKIRKGEEIGLSVTLRGDRMWHFLDRLINIAFPRTKDFRGMPVSSFDGSGNYTIGIREQTSFPEIDPNEITKLRGMEITIVTSTINDIHAKALLDKFGFPFKKDGKEV
ncbi:MAG: 50S ribosomal protein L5 [bacterium]